MSSESKIEKECGDYAFAMGFGWHKVRMLGQRGMPDRILVVPGMPAVFVELKTTRGSISWLQRLKLHELIDMGQEVWIVRSVNDLVTFVEEYRERGWGHAEYVTDET